MGELSVLGDCIVRWTWLLKNGLYTLLVAWKKFFVKNRGRGRCTQALIYFSVLEYMSQSSING